MIRIDLAELCWEWTWGGYTFTIDPTYWLFGYERLDALDDSYVSQYVLCFAWSVSRVGGPFSLSAAERVGAPHPCQCRRGPDRGNLIGHLSAPVARIRTNCVLHVIGDDGPTS
jgi:hypothetical protein